MPIGAEDKFEGVVDLVTHEGDLLGRCDAGHEVRDARDPRRTRRPLRKEWREKMVESRRRGRRGADEQVPRGQRALGRARSRRACACARSPARSCRCCAARRSRTRACRRCSTRSSTTCRRRPTFRRSKGELENGTEGERRASDDEPFAGLAFKIMTDPFVGQLVFFRVYSGVVNSGDTIYNPIKGRKERDRPHPADARQPARGHQGSARGRHRRGGGPEGSDDRRYAVRPGQGHHRSRR